MAKGHRGSDIQSRIEAAVADKDWGEVSDILDNATCDDAEALKPILPELVACRRWLVRASAVDAIGFLGLRQLLDQVKSRLADRNMIVRGYALGAYYDLLGAKALPVIEDFCGAKDVGLRVDALALDYIETRDRDVFDRLRKILVRKRCSYFYRYASLHMLEAYLDIRRHPEIIALFEEILPLIPRSYGLAKDLRKKLKEWKKGQVRKPKGGH